jgi:hypothetical protein
MRNKTLQNVIVTVVTIAVAGLIVYYWDVVPASHMPQVPVASNVIPVVATGTLSESGTIAGQNYSVTAYYPKLTNSAAADIWNAYAETIVRSQINDFKTAVSQNDISRLPPSIKSLGNNFNITYAMDGISNNYASAIFYSETYLIGMAHPAHLLTPLNVDLRTGAIIQLADLFTPGTNYAQTLSDLTTADILKQIQSGTYGSTPDFLSQTGGTAADPANFQVFGLSPQGLVIHFQDYQVGPGAAGPATVVIPYASLKDIAATGGFLDQ